MLYVPGVRCHDCDHVIPEGQSIRRTLRTGGIGCGEMILLALLGPIGIVIALLINPVKTKKVSLCSRCNVDRNRRKASRLKQQVIAYLVFVLLIVVAFFACSGIGQFTRQSPVVP
jgi:hypothetical protein